MLVPGLAVAHVPTSVRTGSKFGGLVAATRGTPVVSVRDILGAAEVWNARLYKESNARENQ